MTQVPSRFERSMENLSSKNSRSRHADCPKIRQAANLVALWKRARFVIESGMEAVAESAVTCYSEARTL